VAAIGMLHSQLPLSNRHDVHACGHLSTCWHGLDCRTYASIEEVEDEFERGLLHPADLKKGLSAALNELIRPVCSIDLHISKGDSTSILMSYLAMFQHLLLWWLWLRRFESTSKTTPKPKSCWPRSRNSRSLAKHCIR
jgi:hypothetical protein